MITEIHRKLTFNQWLKLNEYRVKVNYMNTADLEKSLLKLDANKVNDLGYDIGEISYKSNLGILWQSRGLNKIVSTNKDFVRMILIDSFDYDA